MNDAGQRAICCSGCHHKFKGARLVDGAGEHRITLTFFHRQALTGNGCLIQCGMSAHDAAIQGKALARAHPHPCADLHTLGRKFEPAPIGLLYPGLLRRQQQQIPHGPPRPIQRTRLDTLGQREQHHHHCSFGPLPDQQGARHGNTHQRIDVQIAVAHRDPALFEGGDATQQHPDHRQTADQPVSQSTPMRQLRAKGGNRRHRQRPPVLRGHSRCPLHGPLDNHFGAETQRADRSQHAFQNLRGVRYRQHTLHQIEFQARHPRHTAKPVAQQVFLNRAIHLQNADTRGHRARDTARRRELHHGGLERHRPVTTATARITAAASRIEQHRTQGSRRSGQLVVVATVVIVVVLVGVVPRFGGHGVLLK